MRTQQEIENDLKRELSAARQKIEKMREREAACCPEDVPFDEYIKSLRADLEYVCSQCGAAFPCPAHGTQTGITTKRLVGDLGRERKLNARLRARLEAAEKVIDECREALKFLGWNEAKSSRREEAEEALRRYDELCAE